MSRFLTVLTLSFILGACGGQIDGDPTDGGMTDGGSTDNGGGSGDNNGGDQGGTDGGDQNGGGDSDGGMDGGDSGGNDGNTGGGSDDGGDSGGSDDGNTGGGDDAGSGSDDGDGMGGNDGGSNGGGDSGDNGSDGGDSGDNGSGGGNDNGGNDNGGDSGGSDSDSGDDGGSDNGNNNNNGELAALLQKGETDYVAQCEGCHGAAGDGLFKIDASMFDLTGLTKKIADDMPPNSESECEGECARATAAYILNGYSTEVSDNGGGIVDGGGDDGSSGDPDACNVEITKASPARRLNGTEIQNAVNDIFGVGGSEFENLPRDGTLGGFATVGSYMSSGDFFTENYLDAATNAVDVIVDSGAVAMNCGGGDSGSGGGGTGGGGGVDPVDPPSGDECDTTGQCRNIYGNSATDCKNSGSNMSVCMCGSQPCAGNKSLDAIIAQDVTKSCITDTIKPYGKKLFRRDLTATELDRLFTVANSVSRQTGEDIDGLKAALLSLLTSTHFLFVTPEEAVVSARALTGRELATKMALTLWVSVPDTALLNAAKSGALETESGFNQQLERMIGDPKFDRFKNGFFGQWMALEAVPNADIQTDEFGMTDEEWAMIAADMQKESSHFVDYLIENNLPVKEMLTANYSFLNKRLGDHYGINVNTNNANFVKTMYPANSPRRGVLTHGAVLAQSASGDHASVVIRGEALLAGFLCDPAPAPSGALLDAVDEQLNSPDTEKQKMALRAQNPVCLSCHAKLDPLGWSFTSFDAVAREATADPDGDPLDPSGVFNGENFDGIKSLIDIIAETDQFPACVSEKFYIYSVGRGVSYEKDSEDRCAIDATLQSGGMNTNMGMKDLIKALIKSEMFTTTGTEIAN